MLSAVSFSCANFIPTNAEIDLMEPLPKAVKTYDAADIPIVVVVKEPLNAPQNYHHITNIYYSIDEYPTTEITNITESEKDWFSGTCTEYRASASIANLTAGNHTLRAYSVDDLGNRLSTTREFAYQPDLSSKDINTESSGFDYTPVLLIVGGLIVIIVVGCGVFFFKKQKSSAANLKG